MADNITIPALTSSEIDNGAKVTSITSGKKLFHRDALFALRETDPNSEDGFKQCTVNFPTDQQWCQRARKLITVARAAGNNSIKTDIPKLESASTELFDSIIHSSTSDFDDAEKLHVIERLERCKVVDSRKVGGQWEIVMKVLGGVEVTHILRSPSRKQTMEYGHQSVDVKAKRGGSETKVVLEPTMELWRKLMVSAEGYAGGGPFVPVVHMDVAITELLSRVREELEDADGDEDTTSGE